MEKLWWHHPANKRKRFWLKVKTALKPKPIEPKDLLEATIRLEIQRIVVMLQDIVIVTLTAVIILLLIRLAG